MTMMSYDTIRTLRVSATATISPLFIYGHLPGIKNAKYCQRDLPARQPAIDFTDRAADRITV